MTDRERLIELIREMENHPEKTCPHFDDEDCFNCPYDKEERCDMQARKADYLLQNGVIVPPCKVGDTVYSIYGLTDTKNIIKFTVNALHITSGKNRIGHKKPSYVLLANTIMPQLTSRVYLEEFGKTVFITRQEAEKALAEREEKNEKP